MSEPPVDPERILSELGVRYMTADLPESESGQIRRAKDGKYEVLVNANEGPQRRRFTAAHELAHFLLHRDLIDEHGHLDRLFGGAKNPSEPFSEAHEVQANKLAAQILMPKSRITALWQKDPDPEVMARQFSVSPAAMKIRLKTLRLFDS
ncbi:ImmA/IrrE family metallo-endopeptidase [Jiella flava]|nr:ImmA/IrrE family metallo-endopeptidase [Jiella flava]